MNTDLAVTLARQTVYTALMISGPMPAASPMVIAMVGSVIRRV